MKISKDRFLSWCCFFFISVVFAQNPLDRALLADSYFYNPSINTANQLSFPNGASSTAALQSMINSLSNAGGGVLTINAGTYTLGQIHIKTGVHIRVYPEVIFKTTPMNSMFRVGYDNNFENVSNWSFQSTNGEKFTFDFSDMQPNDGIRAFQLGNTTNFRLADFVVLDNYTKFNAVSSGAVGNTNEPAKFASFGIIENLDIKKAHYGYGLTQNQVIQNTLFRDLSGEGGVTLRLESGFSGLADLYVTDKTLVINNVYGRNISCTNGAHAVMMSPHTITQGMVDVRDILGVSCEAVVSINFGFLSKDKGQSDANGNAINGHSAGTFSEESVIANVSATYGVNAQVRAARLRHIPCALRNYISSDKNLDDESYQAPSLAPVYYLALEEYVSKGNPAGRYKIVLDNVTHTGFSSEVRADGLITDGGENDFEGCDIDGSPIWITGEDKNTPNPLQTSTVAETLNTHKELMNDVVIYQLENQQVLRVKSDFNAKIKIYNLIGQLVKNVVKNNNEISIDTSQLSESVYIIRIESENKIITKKIIIK
ncbi:T9SS type A sorting domain-containing protein [Polaribacter sp. NJDZ03]|uniref:T9SS type A sorting domain-containing protein n=1 Tax=Polaribacter sp. NJDZ03 TaxID=2855841 RepID=UPI001C4A53A2|nr:T9SS type A sorting domain-containing protein [Polaribacter sp. NJDZ03]